MIAAIAGAGPVGLVLWWVIARQDKQIHSLKQELKRERRRLHRLYVRIAGGELSSNEEDDDEEDTLGP